MSDVRVPNDWKAGDCVSSFDNSKNSFGLIIDFVDHYDPHSGHARVAEVFWSDGRTDYVNCECLFYAFEPDF